MTGAALAQTAPDLREAARLDQAGRCKESEVIYQRALAQAAPGPALLNNTGNHYLICGQPEKARVSFERLLQVVPGHANASLQLARMELAAGAFVRAEALLAPLAEAHPKDFDVLLLLGRAAARAGHMPQARQALEAALRLRPDDAAVLTEAGLASAAAGDSSRAVFLLARARASSPRHPGIALALARAAEDAGFLGDAVLAYEAYLQLAPQDAAARRDRARARGLTNTGREQGARELQAYLKQFPNDALGHFALAQVQWREEPEASLRHLAEAVRIDAALTPALVAQGWLLHRVGRTEEALAPLQTALRLDPGNVRALDQLGVTLLALERAKEAEAPLRVAAARAPDDPGIALHLGRALMEQGKETEGQRYLDAYEKLRPARQRDARREAGMIELATLDPAARRAREIERFTAMSKARPDDPVLQLHLARLLLADGQSAPARALLQALTGSHDAGIAAQARDELQRGDAPARVK
ncbi:MAG: tetratricopeptide repeat protein [Acidobacteria bacterium]|nr:tetratricopeptide repeat protein [Acidobacteriota bacterium]